NMGDMAAPPNRINVPIMFSTAGRVESFLPVLTLVLAERHSGDVDIARLPAVAMAPENVGETDADAEGLTRRAARQDRLGAREAGILGERQDDAVLQRYRVIIIVGAGPAVDAEGLAITLAAAVDEDEVVGDHAAECGAILR